MSAPELLSPSAARDSTGLGPQGLDAAPGHDVGLRPMTRADVDAVTAIEADSYPLDPWPPDAFDAAVGSPRTYVCRVAVDPAGAVVGYAVVLVAGDQAELHNLAVRADHRRRGLARRLLDDVLAAVVGSGAREVFLEVQHDNEPAIAFYTAYGFAVVGRRRNYYARGVDALLMRRPLPDPDRELDDR